jgi:hypothetical protein
MWDAFSDERTGLPFTITAGSRQRSHSLVIVQRDSWPYFTVSDSRLPQTGGPGPHIYIPQEQGVPVLPPGTGLLTDYSPFKLSPLYSRGKYHAAQKTRHVSEYMSIGPLSSTGNGADYIENTSSIVPYNYPVRTTAKNIASPLLCVVTVYSRTWLARAAEQRSVCGPQKTLLMYCWPHLCCGRCLRWVDTSQYYPPTYVLVFLVFSFLLALPPITSTHS